MIVHRNSLQLPRNSPKVPRNSPNSMVWPFIETPQNSPEIPQNSPDPPSPQPERVPLPDLKKSPSHRAPSQKSRPNQSIQSCLASRKASNLEMGGRGGGNGNAWICLNRKGNDALLMECCVSSVVPGLCPDDPEAGHVLRVGTLRMEDVLECSSSARREDDVL